MGRKNLISHGMHILRGHHLLCLPRFRGFGYSKEFTANVARIAKSLSDKPRQFVLVTDGPDDICRLCPHLAGTGRCALEEKPRVRERDRTVLKLLGIRPGEYLPYLELTARLAVATGGSLPGRACAGCGWQAVCLGLPEG